MLQHSNKQEKGMTITYITCSSRITTWLLLQHTGTCHKRHGKSAKVYPDLAKSGHADRKHFEASRGPQKKQATTWHHGKQEHG